MHDRAGCSACPPTLLRDRMSAWFPMGVHLIQGLYGTARSIESTVAATRVPGHAGHPGRRPRPRAQQPCRGRHPLRRRGSTAPAGCCWSRSAGWPRATSPPSQFLALEGLRREIGPAPQGADPLAVADREDELAAWLARHGVADGWELAATFAAAASTSRGASGWRHSSMSLPSGPAWSGWRAPCPRRPCSSRSGRPPAGSPSWWARCAPTRRWTAPPCNRSTSPRGSRARW